MSQNSYFLVWWWFSCVSVACSIPAIWELNRARTISRATCVRQACLGTPVSQYKRCVWKEWGRARPAASKDRQSRKKKRKAKTNKQTNKQRGRNHCYTQLHNPITVISWKSTDTTNQNSAICHEAPLFPYTRTKPQESDERKTWANLEIYRDETTKMQSCWIGA